MNEKKKLQPKVRFREFTGENAPDWEQRKLGEVVERVTRKNHNLISTLPLTISAQFGLVDQTTFFKKQVASKDVSGYYLLKNGEFAYNKSYSKDYPWGTIKRLDLYDRGVLSTLYILFKPVLINSDFLVAYYETDYWHKEVAIRSAEGARNHGLLNITARDFFDTRLIIPENNIEQKKIGHLFEKLDKLITLHQRKLEQLEQLKNTLLSKMFPKSGTNIPEIRFSGFTDAWKQRKLGEMSTSFSGGTPTVGVREYYNGEIPFIRSAEIGKCKTELYVSKLGLDNSSARLVSKGDILYAMYGATSGEVARSQIDGAINQAILVIKPVQSVDSEYITQWLRKNKQKIIKTFLQGGQGNLSASIIKNLKVYFPTIEEQQKIGNVFNSFDRSLKFHLNRINELKCLKNNLLNKMFI